MSSAWAAIACGLAGLLLSSAGHAQPSPADLRAHHAAFQADGEVRVAVSVGWESRLTEPRQRGQVRAELESLVRSYLSARTVEAGEAERALERHGREPVTGATVLALPDGAVWMVEPFVEHAGQVSWRVHRLNAAPLTLRVTLGQGRAFFLAGLGEEVFVYVGHARHGRGPAFASSTDYFRMGSYELAPLLEVRQGELPDEPVLDSVRLMPNAYAFETFAPFHFHAHRPRSPLRDQPLPLLPHPAGAYQYVGGLFLDHDLGVRDRGKLIRGGAVDLFGARTAGRFRSEEGQDARQLFWFFACKSAKYFATPWRHPGGPESYPDGYEVDVPPMFPDPATSPKIAIGSERIVIANEAIIARFLFELLREVGSTDVLVARMNAHGNLLDMGIDCRRGDRCFTTF